MTTTSESTVELGRVTVGDGPERVIVLHDWMGDHRNYDAMRPTLDQRTFTYAFVDVRGYGLSRHLTGCYDVHEASADVLALAEHLGWTRFHLIGHSMTSLVAQEVAARAPQQVVSLVLLAPVPPTGMGAPQEAITFLEQIAIDEAARRASLAGQFGDRYAPGWFEFKMQRWAESSRPEASRGYVRMFATQAVSQAPPRDLPVLAVVGEHDREPFVAQTVQRSLGAAYEQLEVIVCPTAGHYPMQETPVLLATHIDRFLRRHPLGR